MSRNVYLRNRDFP